MIEAVGEKGTKRAGKKRGYVMKPLMLVVLVHGWARR